MITLGDEFPCQQCPCWSKADLIQMFPEPFFIAGDSCIDLLPGDGTLIYISNDKQTAFAQDGPDGLLAHWACVTHSTHAPPPGRQNGSYGDPEQSESTTQPPHAFATGSHRGPLGSPMQSEFVTQAGAQLWRTWLQRGPSDESVQSKLERQATHRCSSAKHSQSPQAASSTHSTQVPVRVSQVSP